MLTKKNNFSDPKFTNIYSIDISMPNDPIKV